MAPSLDVHIHLQDDRDNCGPACAQMIAGFFGALAEQKEFQDALPANMKVNGWTTTPDQLAAMIATIPGLPATYSTFKYTKRSTAMRRIATGLAANRPVAVLMSGSDHWVVVSGLTGTGPFVHMANPFPPLDDVSGFVPNYQKPPPPHAIDDHCLFLNGMTPDKAGDEVMSPSTWLSSFTACAPPGSTAKRFILVAPKGRLTAAVAHPIVMAPAPQPLPLTPTGDRSLSSADADTAARSGLNSSGLLALPQWAESALHFDRAPAKTALIHRLDQAGAYYLVGLDAGNGRGVLAGVDARTGELLFARLNPGAEFLNRLFVPLAEILNSTRALNADGGPAIRLVWQSTANTFFSPFYPFAEITPATGPPIFVRLGDRRRFAALQTMRSGQN